MFKKLTPNNWKEHDPAVDCFVRPIENGVDKIDEKEWANRILKSKLSAKVPKVVQNLFNVSQATLCYGWFYYPLYTLGIEQSYRVLETALRIKCDQLGAPNEK